METIYKMITERIEKMLAAGVVPWRKPWTGGKGTAGAPRNLITDKPYRGINQMMLACSGFASPYWLTLKQANELGGKVRKGSESTPVVFWKFFDQSGEEVKEGTSQRRARAMLRYYRVFNVDQCEGLKHTRLEAKVTEPTAPVFNPIEQAEQIVKGYMDRPEIRYVDNRGAFYSPTLDYINMPPAERFTSPAEYYSTLFHECAHSTGHERRLKRDGVADGAHVFGDENYSKEELVAEFTAAFLCGVAGIENATLANSAAYIKGWTKTIKENPSWLICAAGAAQKAADYIQGIKHDKAPKEPVQAPEAALAAV